jgi:hypothetical protein
MKISVACPNAVHQNQSVLQPLNSADTKVAIEGGVLGFEFNGEDPLSLIREWDEGLGLAIADADDPTEIMALSQLKAALGDIHRHVQRESSYSQTRASEVEEATDDDAVSHLQGEQHTSTDDSSEQHGAEPENEENVNVEAEEQEPAPRQRKR